jgi:hypothetical protein
MLRMIRGKALTSSCVLGPSHESRAKSSQVLRLPHIEPRRIDMNPSMTQIADVEHSTWQ